MNFYLLPFCTKRWIEEWKKKLYSTYSPFISRVQFLGGNSSIHNNVRYSNCDINLFSQMLNYFEPLTVGEKLIFV